MITPPPPPLIFLNSTTVPLAEWLVYLSSMTVVRVESQAETGFIFQPVRLFCRPKIIKNGCEKIFQISWNWQARQGDEKENRPRPPQYVVALNKGRH